MIAFAHGDGVGGCACHRVPPQRVEEHFGADGSVHERRHEFALVGHPVQVRARGGAAAHKAQRGAAVELLASCRQLDPGERIADGFGGAHRYAADRIDQARETAEADLGVVVDAYPGGLLDGLHEQGWAPDRERGVDLVAAVVGNGQVRVSRDRHQRRRCAGADPGDVHHHDGVGVAAAEVTSGAEVGLLFGR